ncbi:MAG: polyprenyl synthetase family protein [Acidobacteria bacterium]|nr:MAG: polyprenyl synthetase family protein [Acidobacteriota bacterium]
MSESPVSKIGKVEGLKTMEISAPAVPTFEDLLESFRQKLEDELRAWLAVKRAKATRVVPASGELTGVLSDYVFRGGKRLRPALLYYSYRSCGGTTDETVLPLAMAVELLHTYLLAHDDIMDRAEVRRGEPAVHLVFSDLHDSREWAGDSGHFGQSVAILLGDLAQAYSMELFVSTPADENWPELRQAFCSMVQEVIVGQYLEMTAGYREDLGEEELLRVLRMKSGRYSVEWPMHLGAILAGATAGIREGLCRYGSMMGEAFQLQDDLLGMFGDPERVGKPVGADLAEGKFTVLIHHALRQAPPAGRELLGAALGNPDLTPEEVSSAQQVIRETGAEEKVVQMIDERMGAAQAVLASLELEPEGKRFFEGLVEYLRGREA